MGKQGPCYHCGITTTPLWRNGPPEKPVLCNACGSRWRTKGTLMNYMPMHSGGFGVGTENARWGMKNSGRAAAAAATEKVVSRKRKEPSDGNSESGLSKASTYFSTSVEEDGSTRSSLGSEVSTFDGPLSSVPVRGTPWDTPVPSRRRTNLFRSRASSDKITRNLVSLEEQEVSSVTCPSSEAILFETKSPLVAVEIGLGSVFIRHPAHSMQPPQQQEHESEASSLLIESCKGYDHSEDGSQMESRRMPLYSSSKGKEKFSRQAGRAHSSDKHYNPNKSLLENFPYNKRDVLQSIQSPLIFLELKDIVNFDTFTGLLTDQEQLQLMQHLSSVDASQGPESLRSMFNSTQFEGALSNFQRLLSGGTFDASVLGYNPRLLQHHQQLLSVTDLTASKWMESLSQLQTRSKRRTEPSSAKDKLKVPGGGAEIDSPPAGTYPTSLLERTGDSKVHASQNSQQYLPHSATHFQGDISNLKLESTVGAGAAAGPTRAASTSAGYESRCKETMMITTKKTVKNVMEEGHDSGGEQDLDLLVDVPSSMSFHDNAGLLLHKPQQQKPAPASWTTTKSMPFAAAPRFAEDHSSKRTANLNMSMNDTAGDLIVTNTWHMDNAADWDGLIWNPSKAGERRVLPNGTVLNP